MDADSLMRPWESLSGPGPHVHPREVCSPGEECVFRVKSVFSGWSFRIGRGFWDFIVFLTRKQI